MGRKLKVLLAVIALIVVSAIVAVALSPPAPETPGDGDGEEEPTLIEKPASELVIALADMSAGWSLQGEGPLDEAAAGLTDNYSRSVAQLTNGFRFIGTNAWVFDSIENATAFYDDRVAEVEARYSTETRGHGDEATYWELTSNNLRLLIRKSNVVWQLRYDRENAFVTFDPSIGAIADTLISKAA